MKVAFWEKLPIAKNIFTFKFKKPTGFMHTAGQFIRINLEHDSPDDRGMSRFFTLSAAPSEDYLSITTKFSVPSSSFKSALKGLKPGSEITMSQPSGDFTLPDDKSAQLVFVAGGIGVTPYRSIIKWLKDTDQKHQIHLIYAANTVDEIAFRDLFDALSWLKVTYVINEPNKNWAGETGRLDGDRIKEISGGFNKKIYYLSGPEPMVESFEKQLIKLGLAKEQIKTDFFPGYTSM